MLQRLTSETQEKRRGAIDGTRQSEFVSLRDIADFIRRYAWTILIATALTTAAGALHVLTATPLFTARALLVIDPTKAGSAEGRNGDVAVPIDSAQVESQIEFLRSERIAGAVVSELKLADDPEFGGGVGERSFSLSNFPFDLFPQPAAMSASVQQAVALGIFGNKLNVRRVGQSYLIEITFTSEDPEKAARIANATADSYIGDQVAAKSQAAQRSSTWLEARIADLRKQLNQAARTAQEFRANNNIVDTGPGGLLDDQQLSELNTQLVLAKGRTAETKARLDRIADILKSGVTNAAVIEVLGNTVISSLRERSVAATNREVELTARYGPDSESVKAIKAEGAEYTRGIADELKRISETYRSDYEVAKAREEAISADVANLVKGASATRKAQITAAELETVAQTYRRLYESYLQNLADSVQRVTYSDSDARVITTATTPLSPSYPRTKLFIAVAALVGGMAGLGIAFLQQNLDRSVYSAKQVRQELDVDCLGLLPKVGQVSRSFQFAMPKGRKGFLSRTSTRAGGRYRELLNDPVSQFADSLRDLKTSVALGINLNSVRCVAVSSLSIQDGKSTVASNLATAFALSGTRTILIDGNVGDASLSKTFAPDASTGLMDVLQGRAKLGSAIRSTASAPFDFLPAAGHGEISNAAELLGSDAMRLVLADLQTQYQLVVIDLPALEAGAGARAISPLVDSIVLVAGWGHTSIDVLRDAIQFFTLKQVNMLGVIINKIDARAMRRMRELGDTYYV